MFERCKTLQISISKKLKEYFFTKRETNYFLSNTSSTIKKNSQTSTGLNVVKDARKSNINQRKNGLVIFVEIPSTIKKTLLEKARRKEGRKGKVAFALNAASVCNDLLGCVCASGEEDRR